jgi:hypothetical protein
MDVLRDTIHSVSKDMSLLLGHSQECLIQCLYMSPKRHFEECLKVDVTTAKAFFKVSLLMSL